MASTTEKVSALAEAAAFSAVELVRFNVSPGRLTDPCPLSAHWMPNWFVSSSDQGASFGNEAHVSGPFDMLTAPNSRGYFVGDYEGLAASGEAFKAFFVAANSGNTANRTDVFATTVTP